MLLDPNWRILTVGDGDLSFSHSLVADKGCQRVSASVLDTEQQLRAKYSRHSVDWLRSAAVDVHFGLDITKHQIANSVLKHRFDLLIFQFPLISAASKARTNVSRPAVDTNLLNRSLLHDFLRQSRRFFLDPQGQQLCYLTSKDVKPYSHWQIENLADDIADLTFLGTMPFNSQDFQHYRVRNVERDKLVKDTQSLTYVWSADANSPLSKVVDIPKRLLTGYCRLCGKGPFTHPGERQQHEQSQMHRRLYTYELNWQAFLSGKNTGPQSLASKDVS